MSASFDSSTPLSHAAVPSSLLSEKLVHPASDKSAKPSLSLSDRSSHCPFTSLGSDVEVQPTSDASPSVSASLVESTRSSHCPSISSVSDGFVQPVSSG